MHTKRYGQVKAVRRHPGTSTELTNLSSRKLPNEMLAEGKLPHLSLELHSQYLLVSCYQEKRRIINSLSRWQQFLTTGSEQLFSEDQSWQALSHLWCQVPRTEWRLTGKTEINKSGGMKEKQRKSLPIAVDCSKVPCQVWATLHKFHRADLRQWMYALFKQLKS